MMKLTLGLLTKNEEFFLSYSLPVWSGYFDEIIAVDSQSTDGTVGLLQKYKAKVITRPWDWRFDLARNVIHEHATGDWIYIADADEAHFVSDLMKIRARLQAPGMPRTLVCFPRTEITDDFKNEDRQNFPDRQGRLYPLRMGFLWGGHPIHTTVHRGGAEFKPLYLDDAVIYHYQNCKPSKARYVKGQNYYRSQHGMPLLTEIPPGVPDWALAKITSGVPCPMHPLVEYATITGRPLVPMPE